MEMEKENEVRIKRRGRENAGISFERYIKRIREKKKKKEIGIWFLMKKNQSLVHQGGSLSWGFQMLWRVKTLKRG